MFAVKVSVVLVLALTVVVLNAFEQGSDLHGNLPCDGVPCNGNHDTTSCGQRCECVQRSNGPPTCSSVIFYAGGR
uniref:Putative tick defensin n=1 Tax=Rhipicephalus pulchellus TaxID=72859 RepID=L7MCH6_RHIPC